MRSVSEIHPARASYFGLLLLKIRRTPAADASSALGEIPVTRNTIAAIRLTPWLGTPIGMVTVTTVAVADVATRDRETRRLG
ncbi:MAG: hypothetical protein M3O26_13865 [Pseudomonadota bacterium]|nr:hypothetical protein [Pseudomonadota bacterium]